MQVEVHGHNVEITTALRADIEGRVKTELARLAPDVARVTVRVHEPAGPQAGQATQCSLLLAFHPSGGFRVLRSAASAAEAVGHALLEARRALGRLRAAGRRERLRPAYSCME